MISPFHLHIWECPPLVKWKRVDHENKKKEHNKFWVLSVSGMKQKQRKTKKKQRNVSLGEGFCLKTLVKENSTRFRSKKNNVIVEENRLDSYVWKNKTKKTKMDLEVSLNEFLFDFISYILFVKAFCMHFTNFFKWS